jgi:glucose/arabinose dehydrogenase
LLRAASNAWRWVAVAPGGDVFATDSDVHTLTVLRDTNGDGTADERHVFAEGLARPFGIAFAPDTSMSPTPAASCGGRYKQTGSSRRKAQREDPDMPAEPGHWTRNIVFSPDGARLFVTLGSSSDAGAPDADRALVFSVKPDGSDRPWSRRDCAIPSDWDSSRRPHLVDGRAGARQARRRSGARLHHQPA